MARRELIISLDPPGVRGQEKVELNFGSSLAKSCVCVCAQNLNCTAEDGIIRGK